MTLPNSARLSLHHSSSACVTFKKNLHSATESFDVPTTGAFSLFCSTAPPPPPLHPMTPTHLLVPISLCQVWKGFLIERFVCNLCRLQCMGLNTCLTSLCHAVTQPEQTYSVVQGKQLCFVTFRDFNVSLVARVCVQL